MKLTKFEIRALLKHYRKHDYKVLPQLEEYVNWKEKVSLVNVWHNDGSNVSRLEKKTLKIYHVKLWNIENIRIVLEECPQKNYS